MLLLTKMLSWRGWDAQDLTSFLRCKQRKQTKQKLIYVNLISSIMPYKLPSLNEVPQVHRGVRHEHRDLNLL